MKLTDLAPVGAKISVNPVNAWDSFKTPYIDNIAEGSYISEILHIDASSLEDAESTYKYLDCYQRLIDPHGNAVILRFRIYSGRDLTAWAKTMERYGFDGELSELAGVHELVEIKHGKNYAYISSRKLIPATEDEPVIEHATESLPYAGYGSKLPWPDDELDGDFEDHLN